MPAAIVIFEYYSILYLGLTSTSRQMLLREAQIPFQCVTHNVDETFGRQSSAFDHR